MVELYAGMAKFREKTPLERTGGLELLRIATLNIYGLHEYDLDVLAEYIAEIGIDALFLLDTRRTTWRLLHLKELLKAKLHKLVNKCGRWW